MAYDFITREDLQQALREERRHLAEQLRERDEEIRFLKESCPEWLTTKQACKALGISRPTLLTARDAPGSLIVVSYEGDKGGTVLYNRDSLNAYKKSKTVRRTAMAA